MIAGTIAIGTLTITGGMVLTSKVPGSALKSTAN